MVASPLSSPRLPSPPPIAEVQLGPKSPTGSPDDLPPSFDSASRRIRPGTKAADMPEGPPLVDLTDINTPFQLTEHLQALYASLTHPPNSPTTIPITRQTATRLAQPPDGVDRYLWLYELCRFLCQKVNAILVALFADTPPCSAATCNEMRASEWQYLCAVHDPPKPCCAIDYCCHTLDWAANVLTSPKNFPSRLALGAMEGAAGGQAAHNAGIQQLKQLTNIFRRVYRIFAHAWFQHRDMFWKVEGRTGLYVFFKTVCDVYHLIPEDNYTVPPQAEGLDDAPVPAPAPGPTILTRDHEKPEPRGNTVVAAGNTTKRHHKTPSDNPRITPVPEEKEEEDEKPGSEAAEIKAEQAADAAAEEAARDPEPVAKRVETVVETPAGKVTEPAAEEAKEADPAPVAETEGKTEVGKEEAKEEDEESSEEEEDSDDEEDDDATTVSPSKAGPKDAKTPSPPPAPAAEKKPEAPAESKAKAEDDDDDSDDAEAEPEAEESDTKVAKAEKGDAKDKDKEAGAGATGKEAGETKE
ncbi:Mob1/phocein [Trichodelitschia bisporula]|uniref:Mob1/phocein n=1 Tax=Trichodelitschia bisporula TaxID=703511 RepID=A0A6G1I5U1_9PEZI|nr:Mob1/phocein [Trichodelitschia bisporula]